ncbi:MAG: DUF4351 domain-containing protein [Pirellulaceae bacterium]|nr:DUF4351 domain-containing protein [Pirellulaceae bacterium]
MDHDRLFKELLTTFFTEFLQLFFPELAAYLDADSVEFLDKELFTDVTQGDRHEADLVVRARFRGQKLCFLIHVENQARPQPHFPRRMFGYFARLHEKYDLPVYPIAVFSYDTPRRPEPSTYRVDFPDLAVLAFQFRVVQLNRLVWRDFLDRTNPIAAALMAKMYMEPAERARVKLACLRMLAQLQLDPARRELISGFVDAYLSLTMEQERELESELQRIQPQEREAVMEIVTSWMKKGREQGERTLVLRQLRKRLGALDRSSEEQIEALPPDAVERLGEALLDFSRSDDLQAWLQAHG